MKCQYCGGEGGCAGDSPRCTRCYWVTDSMEYFLKTKHGKEFVAKKLVQSNSHELGLDQDPNYLEAILMHVKRVTHERMLSIAQGDGTNRTMEALQLALIVDNLNHALAPLKVIHGVEIEGEELEKA